MYVDAVGMDALFLMYIPSALPSATPPTFGLIKQSWLPSKQDQIRTGYLKGNFRINTTTPHTTDKHTHTHHIFDPQLL
jgi:hypothetical protein